MLHGHFPKDEAKATVNSHNIIEMVIVYNYLKKNLPNKNLPNKMYIIFTL